MKLKISVLIFIFCTFNLLGQIDKEIDSLYSLIKTTTNDTIKANSHYELGWLLKQNDLPSAKAHTDTAHITFEKLKVAKMVALCDFQFATLNRLSGDFDQAIENLDKYQLYIESINDIKNVAFVYFEKGVIYAQKRDYENGLKQFYKSYAISEESKSIGLMSDALNSIGVVYTDMERYPEAIETFKKAIDIYKRDNKGNDSSNSLGYVYSNIGDVYRAQKQYIKAEENYNEGIVLYKKAKNEQGISLINMNLGLMLVEQKHYSNAIQLLNKAYNTQKTNDNKTDLALTLSSLGMAHFEIGNHTESEVFLREGLALKSENKASTRELYFELYRLFQKRDDFEQALHFHKEYVVYKDSIFNEDNLKNINTLQTQFETEKKDKEITKQQIELQKKNTQFNYMAGPATGLLITSLLLWFLFQQRQKRKNQEIVTLKREHQIKTLETLIEGEEKERLRIAKELHDGVNGDLSAIKFKLSSLLEMNNKVIKEAITMIDDSCKQVRAISHNLIPPSLKSFNLVEATEIFCQNMNEVHTPKVEFQFIGENLKLDKKVEVNIYRIIQELVNNSLKHADASEINVQMSIRNNNIHITVEDDGKGYNAQMENKKDGIGLQNIQSRVDYLNANFDVISNKKGTSFTIEIDINKLDEN